MAKRRNLKMYAGDGYSLKLTFFEVNQETGVRTTRDVSGSTFLAQIRRFENAPEVLAEFNIDMSAAGQGEIVIWLTGATVRSLVPGGVWDIQEQAGVSEPTTKFYGTVTVKRDVSR